MKFEFSPHIAFQVKDYENAIEFYEKVIGMEVIKSSEQETNFKCGPINFYVENSPTQFTFFEFKVDNVEVARKKLEEEGCKITQVYSDKSIIIADPYGMRFHIWQE